MSSDEKQKHRDRMDAIREKERYMSDRERRREEKTFALTERKEKFMLEKEQRQAEAKLQQEMMTRQQTLSMQHLTFEQQLKMVGINFDDYVKRQDVDLQFFERENYLLERAKQEEFIRSLKQAIIEHKITITTVREEAKLTRKQTILESERRMIEDRDQKENELWFLKELRKEGLGREGGVSQDEILAVVRELRAKEDAEKKGGSNS